MPRRFSKGGGTKCSGLWLASEWAPSKLLGNPFMNYWYKPYLMLNPLMRVRCKFATAVLGERVLFWACHWFRGKGGYSMELDGIQPLLYLTAFLR